MNTSSLPQYTIFCCDENPASTLTARLVAHVGRETTAISGARAMAISSGKTHIVQIEDTRSVRHIFIRPDEALGASRTLAAVDGFIAMRERHHQIATGAAATEKPSWFAQLKALESQPGYLVYAGSHQVCLEGARYWKGSKVRRDGNSGGYLLLVPKSAIERQIKRAA